MGRNKEPIDLILAKGKSKGYNKEEVERRRNQEVKAKSDCILIPEFLPTHLHDRFLFISEQLQAIGIMSNLDVDCLGRYVLYQNEWEKAVKGLEEIPPYKKDGRRYVANEEYDKMVNITNKLQKAVKQEASGLGLSITDRCKLVIPKVDIPEKSNEDPFDAFFGGDE